jgi:inosose dehydratase
MTRKNPDANATGTTAPSAVHIATNIYPWTTFYRRDNRRWEDDPAAGMAEVVQSGIEGFEPAVSTVEQVTQLAPLAEQSGLEVRSLYVGSKLHEVDDADAGVELVIAVAEAARPLGCRIIVTNPSPIRWGGPENKTDDQLELQARSLDRIGARLHAIGMVLAYHNHDIELRHGAREFHHMLAGTDPRHVQLCLDAHWIYRGCGNSQVAVFDVIRLYGRRIVELHVRQSCRGVWTEAFEDGDVDYARITSMLATQGVRPHIVLEQAVEATSPHTMTALEAHRQGLPFARKVFAPLG